MSGPAMVTTAAGAAGFGQVTLGGLTSGALYALLLIGVLLVFHVSRQVNFAYGQSGMVAAFGSWYLYGKAGLPTWLAVLAGVAAAVALTTVTDVAIIKRLPEDRAGYDLVVTLGVLLLLTAGAESLFGTGAQSYLKLWSDRRATLGGVIVNVNDLVTVALGVAVPVATHLVLTRTGLGVALRASAENPAVARSVGINVGAVRTAVWAVSGLGAAIGAVFFASRLSVDAFYMTPVVIKVFIAGMIGGLDRFAAPIAAAFGLGLYESWTVYFFGAPAATPAVFVLIIAVLSLAPKRFIEERHEARA
jgi:branched-chain amino acid transport system permease protein